MGVPSRKINISHQTGSSENHRLKSAGWDGEYVSSLEGNLATQKNRMEV